MKPQMWPRRRDGGQLDSCIGRVCRNRLDEQSYAGGLTGGAEHLVEWNVHRVKRNRALVTGKAHLQTILPRSRSSNSQGDEQTHGEQGLALETGGDSQIFLVVNCNRLSLLAEIRKIACLELHNAGDLIETKLKHEASQREGSVVHGQPPPVPFSDDEWTLVQEHAVEHGLGEEETSHPNGGLGVGRCDE